MKTGQVEVVAQTLKLLNSCRNGLPIDITDHNTVSSYDTLKTFWGKFISQQK